MVQRALCYSRFVRTDLRTIKRSFSGLFMVTSFMYLSMAIVFSAGPPFRKQFWSNWLLLFALIILYALTLVIVLAKSRWFEEFFEFVYWYNFKSNDYSSETEIRFLQNPRGKWEQNKRPGNSGLID